MKKREIRVIGSFVILSFLLVFFLHSASAFYIGTVRGTMEQVVTSISDIFSPFLSALFTGDSWSGSFLFERFLVLILLVVIIGLALRKVTLFDDVPAVRWIIAVIVPLIGMRFMDYSWLVSILNQYALVSIVLLAVVPFIIYFYFIYGVAEDHGIIRKIGWLFFIGIYMGLWSTSTQSNQSIYFWTFIVALICLFGDNLIQKRFEMIKEYKSNKMRLNNDLSEKLREINRLQRDLNEGTTPNRKLTKERIKELQSDYKWMNKRF